MAVSIQEIIREAKRKSSTDLDLSWRSDVDMERLTEIPEELFELTSLETLIIGEHLIQSVSPRIEKLTNLKTLNLYGNRLSAFPEEVLGLTSLTTLSVDGNNIASLPESMQSLRTLKSLEFGSYARPFPIPTWIADMRQLAAIMVWGESSGLDHLGKMTWLQSLGIYGADLQAVPSWIYGMTDLRSLSVCSSKVERLDNNLAGLTGLKRLNLWNNEIRELPQNIGNLVGLQSLWLQNNLLSELPESIVGLRDLRSLNLSRNPPSAISASLYLLSSLEHLDISDLKEQNGSQPQMKLSDQIVRMPVLEELSCTPEQFVVPPPEVVRKGLSEIKDYFRQLKAEGVDYLYESKLLILGEPGAGKTTLRGKILDPSYELKEEKSTQGIDVTEWSFRLEGGKDFRVNIWDFGGQEIYHATHQFFLTKRSLYLLVADNRREDTDFYYWLNVLELLSDNSPVLIIKNEKQDRHKEINERQLRSEFSCLKESLSANLATDRGLGEIVKSIKHYISSLQHIGTPLPRNWVSVRAELERRDDNYISLNEYLEICNRNGFSALKDKLQLSAYLHDLGVFLHFQDDPLLKSIVILKPKWGTDAVYKVLDNRGVIDARGHFTDAGLADIWTESEYEGMRDELLRLMINFKICYQIPGAVSSYMAPKLLAEDQPAYPWDDSNNLVTKYNYEFMPKGIVTQIIVAMHRYIGENGIVWKSGVVLSREETYAEIIEHYGKREIEIRVRGKNKRDLLAIIDYEFDQIHSSFRHLKFSKSVPCNCDPCKAQPIPHFYKLEILRKFAGDHEDKIQCQVSYKMVSVRGLLDDVGSPVVTEKEAMKSSVMFSGPVGKVIVQQSQEGNNEVSDTGGQDMESPAEVKVKSAWANGLFYLTSFAVVITGIGVLAWHLPFYTLLAVVFAGVLFVLLIGVLQLRQDDRLSEKKFGELAGLVVKQLPIIGNLLKSSNETDR